MPTTPIHQALQASAALLVLALLTVLGIRAAGTNTYEGTVLRVYEKLDDYRVELTLKSGDVRVFVNREQRFPYLKTDTADMQARFEQLEQSKAVVSVTAWGFRNSWFSMFPNAVDVEMIQTAEEARRERAGVIADAVMGTLEGRGMLTEPLDTTAARSELREALVTTVEATIP